MTRRDTTRIRMTPSSRRATTPIAYLAITCAAAMWVGCVSGCESEQSRLEAMAKSASTSRSQAAIDLRKAFYAKEITAQGALGLAHDRVEKPGDMASVDFAGAVLDMLDQISPDVEKAGVNEFYWTRVGTLAGNAAAAAKKLGDNAKARGVVLAGPKRWQNEAYWRQHPDHDVLASAIMFEAGEGKEAVQRLRERAELTEDQTKVVEKMEKDLRRGLGTKP